jgi:hypothetical protein
MGFGKKVAISVILGLFLFSALAYAADTSAVSSNGSRTSGKPKENKITASDETTTSEQTTTPLTEQSITKLLDDNNITYVQASSNAWLLPYECKNMKSLEVAIILNPDWVVFSTVVLTLPEKYEQYEAYRDLLQYDFQVNQGKFAIDSGKLYFLIEVPIRLCDSREVLDDINASAEVVDGIYPDLAEKFGIKE